MKDSAEINQAKFWAYRAQSASDIRSIQPQLEGDVSYENNETPEEFLAKTATAYNHLAALGGHYANQLQQDAQACEYAQNPLFLNFSDPLDD